MVRAALAGLALLIGCAAGPVSETRLGTLPESFLEDRFQVSANSRHVALVVESDSGQAAVVDGRRGPWYGSIGRLELNDNGTFAYAATRGDTALVVRDGREGPASRSIGALAYSLDGKHLAYPAKQADGRWVMMVDGRQAAFHDEISWPARDPGSARLAYSARDGDSWRLVLDGAPGPGWDEINPPRFEDDGRLVYAARRGTDWRVFAGDSSWPSPGGLGGPVLAGATGGAAWVAVDSGRARLVRNGVPGPARDFIIELAATPDLGTVACAARDGGLWTVLVNDSPVARSNGPPLIRVAPNGRVAATIVRDDGRQAMLVDGAEHRPHAGVSEPVFSPDGSRLAYGVADGGLMAVVVDSDQHQYYEAVTRLEFSPDSRRFAYAALKAGRWRLVVDGEEGPWFDAILESPAFFGPDGNRVAYAAASGKTRFIYTDGQRLEPGYDGVRRPVFDGNDRLNLVALRGDTLLSVSRRLPD
ncbi:PD40 domain-containing protein [candidate division WOR-3 bacterium]|nr:PD40 domain-containing protein [candidate division WOR-3 bacterium]